MKFGPRKPSLKRSLSAMTTGRAKRTVKRAINPYYGKKGMGWINNPKKALYNKIYHKTTFSVIPTIGDVKKASKTFAILCLRTNQPNRLCFQRSLF